MEIINLKKVDQTLYVETLENGLTIYMLPNNKVSTYYLNFVCKYGSVDTEFKIGKKEYKVSDGIAHFLEHVNFQISDDASVQDLFKKYGSYINAYTSYDQTVYEVDGSNNIKKNLNLLLDYVQNDYFTEKTIAKEKGIIIEEVRRDKNDINGRIYLESKKALFIKNKKDRMIVGEEEDVRGITLDEVKLIHKVFYNPSNMFLVVTGNFKVKDVIETVRSNQNNKRFEKYDVKKIHHKEPLEVEKSLVEIVDNRVEIPKAIISYKIDREKYKDIEDIELNYYISLILKCNFSASSLLYEELKEKNMISNMRYSADIDDNIIVIRIYIISDKVREVINIVKDKIKNMTMNESDFVRNRRASIANLIYGYDDMEYTTSRIIKQLISYGKIYDNLYDIYNGININKANEIMNKLNFDNESTVILEKQ